MRVNDGVGRAIRVVRAGARAAAAWGVLAIVHALVTLASVASLRRLLDALPVRRAVSDRRRRAVVAETTVALRRAQRYYVTTVACLPVAAACVCVLRLRGVAASLVVGVWRSPFSAHAWAEVDGDVVNDDAAHTSRYEVIMRL